MKGKETVQMQILSRKTAQNSIMFMRAFPQEYDSKINHVLSYSGQGNHNYQHQE
jgi:hypothetical protein